MKETPIRNELAVYLCDPSGEVAIHGSPRDRIEVGKCLEKVGLLERHFSEALALIARIDATWCDDKTGDDFLDAMAPVMTDAARFIKEHAAANNTITPDEDALDHSCRAHKLLKGKP